MIGGKLEFLGGKKMETIIAGIISLLLFVYLLAAVLRPDKF